MTYPSDDVDVVRRTPRFFYVQDPETEHLELGARAAYAYDELHEIAYRLGAAAGIPRAQVPLEWQRRLSTFTQLANLLPNRRRPDDDDATDDTTDARRFTVTQPTSESAEPAASAASPRRPVPAFVNPNEQRLAADQPADQPADRPTSPAGGRGRYVVPTPLPGYRTLNDAEVRLIDLVKRTERDVAAVFRAVANADDTTDSAGGDEIRIDGHWLNRARAGLQDGFMALVRSVTRPEDLFDLVYSGEDEYEYSDDDDDDEETPRED